MVIAGRTDGIAATQSAVPASAASAVAPANANATSTGASVSSIQKTRNELTAYLKKMEPVRLESISSLKLDVAEARLRLTVLAKSGRTQDEADTYLYCLTQLDPAPDDYLDTMLNLADLVATRDDDSGLLTLLFELADNFPAAEPTAQKIHLLEAQYLLRIGGPEAALILYHKMANNPVTLPTVRIEAAARAGYVHERLGQTDLAISSYLQAGENLTAEPMAFEAMLRGTLLLLEKGRMDEALATLQKLRNAPTATLGQSPTAAVIADLLDLSADPEHARAYWAAQEKWLPHWKALAAQLGLKPPPDDQPLLAPYIDNYQQLGIQASTALTQNDAPGFFQFADQLLESARWRPGDLGDAMRILYQGIRLVPDRTDAILAFGEELEKDLPPANQAVAAELTGLRVSELVVNLNKFEEGRDTAQPVLEKIGTTTATGQALARLYGMAVLRTDTHTPAGELAIRYLAQSLEDPAAHGDQRMYAIAILCDLYNSLGREDDARTLLAKELAKPGDPNDQQRTKLQAELNILRQRSLQEAGLDAGLDAWWSQHQLPWYDYVNAKPLAGALSTVDEPAVQAARDFDRALDKAAPLQQRVMAFDSAWNSYTDTFTSGAAVVEATSTFALHQDIPVDLRYLAWSRSVLHLLWTGQRAAAEKLMVLSPAGGAGTDDDRADFTLWDDYLAQPNTVEAQQAFVAKIVALPAVRRPAMLLGMHIINALATLNDTTAAQGVFDQLGTAKLDDESKQEYTGLKANFPALMESYQSTGPIAEALRQVILAARPQEAAAAQLPENWLALNDVWSPNLSLLTLAEQRQGLLAIIRDRVTYGRHPLQPYLDYAQALTFSDADSDLRMKIFETVQQTAHRDDDRFYAAMFTSVIDFDNPEIARKGWADLAPARTKEYPKAGGFIQYYDTLMKWRSGEKVNLVADFGPLDAKDLDTFKLRLAFDYYLQQGDKDNLQKLIDMRDEKDLLTEPVLGGYLKALHFLGKEAALTRAADNARVELAKNVVKSWAQPDSESAEQVFELARILKDSKAYPRAWMQTELGVMHNENDRDLLLMEDGLLQQDWKSVNDAADDYLSRNPTNYDAYWDKAEALIALGRRREALDPLRLYVKYSHNEDDYPAAVALLKKIEAETTTPAASK